MPKIKNKGYYEDELKDTYEVYGVRTYEIKEKEYDNSWTKEVTEVLIYSYGSWGWVDINNYEPVD